MNNQLTTSEIKETLQNNFLEKMHLTSGIACMLNIPESLKNECSYIPELVTSTNKLIKHPDFLLAFFINQYDLEQALKSISAAVHTKTKIWIAYPKSKQLQTDLNRDILRNLWRLLRPK